MARTPIDGSADWVITDMKPAELGLADPEWWTWYREDVVGPAPGQPQWSANNRPRGQVAWVAAVAFCRWLTVRLQARGDLGTGEAIR